MRRAVYIQRADGDWDFVAAFSKDRDLEMPEDWADEIFQWLKYKEETACIIEADLAFLPDILDGDSPLIPGNQTPGEKANNKNN